MYGVGNKLVKDMSFSQYQSFIKSSTGIIFIGNDSKESKKLAKIFVDKLCACEVNRAHFINSSDIDETELKKILEIDEINYPIIIAYKDGAQTAFYDSSRKVDDLENYINNLILSAYPAVCSKAC